YVMESEHGFSLPRGLQIEFARTVQGVTEDTGTEINPTEMWAAFEDRYLTDPGRVAVDAPTFAVDGAATKMQATVVVDGVRHPEATVGSGPIDCVVQALVQVTGLELDVVDYVEHARGAGARAEAVAYVACRRGTRQAEWGVGVDANVVTAGVQALCRVVTRWL